MTKLHKTLRKRMVRTLHEYRMITPGDRILVGVSGGADSLTLLQLLADPYIRKLFAFDLFVLHIDLGFHTGEPEGWTLLAPHFQEMGVPFQILHTTISTKALDPDAKKNPCFICSLNRRRKVYETAHREGCQKIAYGHHKDDIVETLLINILFGRKIEAMHPVQEVFKGSMHIIRPLATIEEEHLKQFASTSGLPVLPKICPADGVSRRQKVKKIIARLQREEKHANIRENIFKSFRHVNMPSGQTS